MQQLSCSQRWMEHYSGEPAAAIPVHPGHGPSVSRFGRPNCPSVDVSTFAAATAAYSQLLNLGLIRMSLPVPANAEFSIVSITDPYQCP